MPTVGKAPRSGPLFTGREPHAIPGVTLPLPVILTAHRLRSPLPSARQTALGFCDPAKGNSGAGICDMSYRSSGRLAAELAKPIHGRLPFARVFLIDSNTQCRLQPYIRSLLQPSVRLLTHDEIRWPRAQLTLRTQSALGFTSCCDHGLTCGCHLFKKHSSNRLGVTPLLNHSKKRLVFTSSRSSGTGRG